MMRPLLYICFILVIALSCRDRENKSTKPTKDVPKLDQEAPAKDPDQAQDSVPNPNTGSKQSAGPSSAKNSKNVATSKEEIQRVVDLRKIAGDSTLSSEERIDAIQALTPYANRYASIKKLVVKIAKESTDQALVRSVLDLFSAAKLASPSIVEATRASYINGDDETKLAASKLLSRISILNPALRTANSLPVAIKMAQSMPDSPLKKEVVENLVSSSVSAHDFQTDQIRCLVGVLHSPRSGPAACNISRAVANSFSKSVTNSILEGSNAEKSAESFNESIEAGINKARDTLWDDNATYYDWWLAFFTIQASAMAENPIAF